MRRDTPVGSGGCPHFHTSCYGYAVHHLPHRSCALGMQCTPCPSYPDHASFISHNPQSASIAAAALWGLSTTSVCRRKLSKLGAIPIVIRNIKRTLAMDVTPNPETPIANNAGGGARAESDAADRAEDDDQREEAAGSGPPAHNSGGVAAVATAHTSSGGVAASAADAGAYAADPAADDDQGTGGIPPAAMTHNPGGAVAVAEDAAPSPSSEEWDGSDDEDAAGGLPSEARRATFQRHLQGALSMLLVDRSCRRPYNALEPDFATLFKLCRNLEGYSVDKDVGQRRTSAAKVLTSLMQPVTRLQ